MSNPSPISGHSVGWRQVGWIFDGPDNLGVDADERFCSLATFAKGGPFREPYAQWMKPCFVEAPADRMTDIVGVGEA